jgi:hypothetical protein
MKKSLVLFPVLLLAQTAQPNAPADECFSFGASFLYWTLSEKGNEIAFAKDYQVQGALEAGANTGAMGIQGDMIELQAVWQPGYRLQMDYLFSSTPFLVFGDYTHYRTEYEKTTSPPTDITGGQAPFGQLMPSSVLNLTTTFQNSNLVLARMKNRINFSYDQARLHFGGHFTPTERVKLQFSFGPEAVWASKRQKVTFTGLNPLALDITEYRWDFRGPGLGSAAHSLLDLGYGIGIDFGVGLSAYYGSSSLFTKATIPTLVAGVSDINQAQAGNTGIFRFLQMTQVFSDVTWDYNWCDYRFSLAAGYEFDGIFNINQQYRATFSGNSSQGARNVWYRYNPLYLHGLRLAGSFGF